MNEALAMVRSTLVLEAPLRVVADADVGGGFDQQPVVRLPKDQRRDAGGEAGFGPALRREAEGGITGDQELFRAGLEFPQLAFDVVEGFVDLVEVVCS